MLVREFVDLLRQYEKSSALSSEQQSVVNQLVTILAPHHGMELENLFDLLRKAINPKRRTRSVAKPARETDGNQSADAFVLALRSSFHDDAAFTRLIGEAKLNRSLTIVGLKGVFSDLFGRTGNFRSKATRDDILRKILDERNIKLRNEKMGEMLGRRPVPAE